MKQVICVLLVGLLFLFPLSGCQSSPEVTTDTTTSPQSTHSTTPTSVFGGIENPPFDWNLTTSPQGDGSTKLLNGTTPASFSTRPQTAPSNPSATQPVQVKRVKAVWISQYDLAPILTGKSATEFSASFDRWCEEFETRGLNTLVIQLRPMADAFYPSKIFPWSHYLTGVQGTNPGFDPLKLMLQSAKAHHLEVHGWVNPYRVWNSSTTAGDLPANNPFAKQEDLLLYSNQYYFDPSSSSARQLIVDGVVELLEGYDLAGIHFDDYFYPTTDPSFDQPSFQAYQKSGGKLSLSAWRKEQVNLLLRAVKQAIQTTAPACLFGISPAGAVNLSTQTITTTDQVFADVNAWVKEGLVDYLCPQIYFGYDNASSPYLETLAVWSKLCQGKVDLWVGLPLYKCGEEDVWAGANGKLEFVKQNDRMKKMTADAFANNQVTGICLFRAEQFLSPPNEVTKQEIYHLAAYLLATN